MRENDPSRNDSAPKGGAKPPSEPKYNQPENGSAEGVALPSRKKLPHEIPTWVQQGERHFITINCKKRGTHTLVKHAAQLLKSAEYYDQIGRWHLWLIVIMPDHIHCIASFDLSAGLKKTVSSWKRYQTTSIGITWQSDFFEHRLRNPAEFDEKRHYIRMNPVRAGLVTNPEEWPHVLDRSSINNPGSAPTS